MENGGAGQGTLSSTLNVQELVCEMGCAVDQMSKEERIQLVKRLDERGAFLFRGAVLLVAARLEVLRHTIYNYLNELRQPAGQKGGESCIDCHPANLEYGFIEFPKLTSFFRRV